MKSITFALAIVGMALPGVFNQALAEQPPGISPLLDKHVETSAQWRISVSPYAWASGLRGKVGQLGQAPIKLNSSFHHIIHDLDLAFMGALEARYDRFSLLADVMYGKLSAGGATQHEVLSQRVNTTSESFSGFLGAGYGILQSSEGHLDLIGGGRVWHASTKISLEGGVLDGRGERDSATWVDAVAGLRGRYALNEHWYLTGWGIIGAGEAKLDWDATAALAYQFKTNFSAVFGYRAMGVNFNRNGFVYNVIQQGPILGLSYRF